MHPQEFSILGDKLRAKQGDAVRCAWVGVQGGLCKAWDAQQDGGELRKGKAGRIWGTGAMPRMPRPIMEDTQTRAIGRLQQDQGPARPHLLTHRQGPLPCEAMDTGMDAQHSPAKGGQVGEGLRVEGAQVGWERWAPQGDSLRQKGTGVGERAQGRQGGASPGQPGETASVWPSKQE